jgi:hypothetical protein
MADNINHPKHYGGEDDPYEAIKVVGQSGNNCESVTKYCDDFQHRLMRLAASDHRRSSVWRPTVSPATQ